MPYQVRCKTYDKTHHRLTSAYLVLDDELGARIIQIQSTVGVAKTRDDASWIKGIAQRADR